MSGRVESPPPKARRPDSTSPPVSTPAQAPAPAPASASSQQPEWKFNPDEYTVGWICALTTEYVAAKEFLDDKAVQPKYRSPNDNNAYALGTIAGHKVVIAVLPAGEYGTSTAASVARDMLRSFRNVRMGLMVGIGGGAPRAGHDIRLGDIVVSISRNGKPAVRQYDFGKAIQGREFQMTGNLNQPPVLLLAAVNDLEARFQSEDHGLQGAIDEVLKKKPKLASRYGKPAPGTDRLFKAHVTHDGEAGCRGAADCVGTPSSLRQRGEKGEHEESPAIHYGLVASANSLMKDALVRDRLAAAEGVLCFEMEAAGLMNHFPCLVVRGICDYSDSHKNKQWQGYAAMAAAAYARELLRRIPPSQVEAEKKILASSTSPSFRNGGEVRD
ncbi:nucleoside phosphorylase domain-containing protein [Lasiosphaeria ovina]|uniref:Nucleoside phosphorylase domain-containing protein n=1 Tax=Lasiosphaeria ovina TaxID=92902 RepID=A0AAE0K669_9PEZI|nr:nucleoside phosphorylase domain-containing protein [Lasiosphaeria ovina]